MSGIDNKHDLVIGIDGGGTHTRVMVCDASGRVLAYREGGSASYHKDANAADNVQRTVRAALEATGENPARVAGLAAGIAGYDSEDDLAWVEKLTNIQELACPKWHVNDAVAAHYGALSGRPGILAIAGTGSIITAKTEDGSYFRNYDFHHYAASAARYIAYDAVFELLAGHGDASDDELRSAMLKHWQAESVDAFARSARYGFAEDYRERDRMFGEFAPFVTEAASGGGKLARLVCDRAIDQMKVGIELLAASFSGDTVDVAFVGSVANSRYFGEQLRARLRGGSRKAFRVTEPRFTPAAGAVLYAMDRLGRNPDEPYFRNLADSADMRA